MGNLSELLANLDDVPRRDADDVQLTIFARRPWNVDSPCLVLAEDAADGRAGSAPGYEYLLEVDLAREVLDVWQRWRGGAAPSPEEAARAVIFYAEHDAYQPV